MQASFVPPEADVTSTIEYFPYFNGRYLAVAASLAGGNVMAAFVKMLQQWTHELGKYHSEVLSHYIMDCGIYVIYTPS